MVMASQRTADPGRRGQLAPKHRQHDGALAAPAPARDSEVKTCRHLHDDKMAYSDRNDTAKQQVARQLRRPSDQQGSEGDSMRKCLTAALVVTVLLSMTSCGRTPQSKSFSLSFDLPAPALNEENRLRASDFCRALASSHISCGLDAKGFQAGIEELQRTSSGTDFQELSSTYVKAARLCHDTKIKPAKYVTARGKTDETGTSVTAAPSVEAVTTPVASVVTVSVPVGWQRKHSTKTEASEVIEYSEQVLVSPESLSNLQELEDRAYVATVETLRKAGFHPFETSDFVATWAWKWADEGKIEFTLHENMTMEAKLFPSGNDIIYKLCDWGDGDWDMVDGRLQITMRRVGKVGVPGLTKEHVVKWIDREVVYLNADHDEVLLADGDKLRRVSEGE